jgi:hypothetical protein
MSKFKVEFMGREEDLVAELGLSLNSLVRRICGKVGVDCAHKTFLDLGDANVGHIRNLIPNVVYKSALMTPTVTGSNVQAFMSEHSDTVKAMVEEWIEDNREKFGELIFIQPSHHEVTDVPAIMKKRR